jgi:hypothetical protein
LPRLAKPSPALPCQAQPSLALIIIDKMTMKVTLPCHALPSHATPSLAKPCLDDNISIDYEMPQKIKAL